MDDLKELYISRKAEFESLLASVKQTLRYLSIARLCAAIVFILFLYLGFSDSIYFSALLVIAIVFIVLVNRYTAESHRSELLQNHVHLNQLEIKALDYDFEGFRSGDRFVNPQHAYSHDLDLFGKGSLFQFINRCGTEIGEEKLASLLLYPLDSRSSIDSRQAAAKDCGSKINFRQQFWSNAVMQKDNASDKARLLQWLTEKNSIEGKLSYRIILVLFPAITLSTLALAIINSAWVPALIIALIIQSGIAGFHAKRTQQAQQALGKHKQVLEKYAVLLQLVSQEEFDSDLFKSLRKESTEAFMHIRKFASLVNALEARMNPIANAFGNSLFIYDLQCVKRLEQWRDQHGHQLSGWLDVVADADALCAVSTFHFNHKRYAFPVIVDELKMKAQALGHPLIPDAERVTNHFSQGDPQTIVIVTGANMAGKSTFLRAIGVNTVLALAGSPVCAETFSCPILGLRSGMRTSDSLQENQSYFYAELYRLQRIIQDLRQGKPLLILLDEILKGTNSTDKQAGSIAMVEQLINLNALVLLATHDVILGDLQQKFPAKVATGCFESQVNGSQLTFDYKMKPGVAQRANATFLMKQMGIIPN